MTSKKSDPDDEQTIEFESGCDEEHKLFILKIKSESRLKDIEFAACLRSFADDIENGTFCFDDLHEKPAQFN